MLAKDDLGRLMRYTVWANHRIMRAAATISSDDFKRDLGGSHGGIRGTLVHTLWGEWVWYRRWIGESPKTIFEESEFADIAAIEAKWNELDQERRLFLGVISDEKLLSTFAYQNLKDERWEYTYLAAMQHVLNHSTYHRGQVVTLLRQLDKIPPVTDYLVFFDEGGGKS